jgi:hypothetical protein
VKLECVDKNRSLYVEVQNYKLDKEHGLKFGYVISQFPLERFAIEKEKQQPCREGARNAQRHLRGSFMVVQTITRLDG